VNTENEANQIRLIDTHCHLVSDRLKENIVELVQRAQLAGVQKIMNIAYDPATVQLALSHARQFESVYCTVGIQPHDADTYNETEAKIIESHALNEKKVVAIGEIGLDAFHKIVPMEQQIVCFEHFLDIALKSKLPVVVHVRETHDLVHDRLKDFAKKGGQGVIHCFTGTKQEGHSFLDLGFFLSFSGIVTFKNSTALQEAAKSFPSNRILIETDSPYLAPMPYRGKMNEPSWVVATCRYLAELRGEKFEEVAEYTWNNAHELFRRLN
jgi:TatD DNase family protein